MMSIERSASPCVFDISGDRFNVQLIKRARSSLKSHPSLIVPTMPHILSLKPLLVSTTSRQLRALRGSPRPESCCQNEISARVVRQMSTEGEVVDLDPRRGVELQRSCRRC